MEIRFYTNQVRSRSNAIAQFVLPFRVELADGVGADIACRGEIIHSNRDGGLAVLWPRMPGDWWAMSGATQQDTERLSVAVLREFRKWNTRGMVNQ